MLDFFKICYDLSRHFVSIYAKAARLFTNCALLVEYGCQTPRALFWSCLVLLIVVYSLVCCIGSELCTSTRGQNKTDKIVFAINVVLFYRCQIEVHGVSSQRQEKPQIYVLMPGLSHFLLIYHPNHKQFHYMRHNDHLKSPSSSRTQFIRWQTPPQSIDLFPV